MPATRRVLVVATAASLALAGCAAQSTPATSSHTEPSATFASVSLDNCGTQVTVDSPPTKVVTIKSTSTEMLLALGLQDVIVGTAFADGPVPDADKAAYEKIPVLSDQVPGQEALLAVEPDFVYGGWESNFSDDGAGDRATLDKLGITTYVSPAACKEPDYMPDPLTFDAVDDEIREVASIFGVQDRADDLIAQEKATLAERQEARRGDHRPLVQLGLGHPVRRGGHRRAADDDGRRRADQHLRGRARHLDVGRLGERGGGGPERDRARRRQLEHRREEDQPAGEQPRDRAAQCRP